MAATAEHRHRLTALQDRVRRAREQSQAAEKLIKAAGDDAELVASGRDALSAAQLELAMSQELQNSLLSTIAGVAHSQSESMLNDPNTLATLEQIAGSGAPIGSMMLGSVVGREELISRIRSGRFDPAMQADVSTAGVVEFGSTTDPSRTGPWHGIVPQMRRRLAVLGAIPTGTMDNASFHFTQETGSYAGPVETAEGAMSPAASANFEDAEVVAVPVPAWLKVPRDQIADVPQLQSALQGRLMYAVLRRIEDQILAGDGTGLNLRGILATSGIASVAFNAAVPLSDLTLDAITAVLLSEAVPDLAVFNPVDLATMLKAKATGSGERLDSEGAFAATTGTLWDLPRVASTAIAPGTALVGDFAMGATLFIREGVTVRMSDSDQDDFLKRRITCLGEARVGLAVWNPTCFAEVHLA